MNVRTTLTVFQIEAFLVSFFSQLRATVIQSLFALLSFALHYDTHLPSQPFLFHQMRCAFHFFTNSILPLCSHLPTKSITFSTTFFSLFSHVSFSQNTVSNSSFRNAFISSFSKTSAQCGAQELPSAISCRSKTHMSLLGPPFSAMRMLTTRAALATRFKATIFLALATLVRLSLAPQESSLDSRVFRIAIRSI